MYPKWPCHGRSTISWRSDYIIYTKLHQIRMTTVRLPCCASWLAAGLAAEALQLPIAASMLIVGMCCTLFIGHKSIDANSCGTGSMLDLAYPTAIGYQCQPSLNAVHRRTTACACRAANCDGISLLPRHVRQACFRTAFSNPCPCS